MEKFIGRSVNIIAVQRYTNTAVSQLAANDVNLYTKATDHYNWLNKRVSSFPSLLTCQSAERGTSNREIVYNRRKKPDTLACRTRDS
jgi:hypothetical protein